MELDLVTERNIQLFMRLAELSARPVAAYMSWSRVQHETYLSYRNGRIHISQLFPYRPFDPQLLHQVLVDWQPAQFFGIPQRLFHLRQGMVIDCSPPANSSAELWLSLHHRQIAFLEVRCIPQ